ncbi:MAG TPA: TetR/AcrR family transcriptional regulator [Labilithrix sp.]|jgi:AcrR family transcriptional regulator
MESTARSQTPKGKKSRDHILAAAEKLFASRGFHGTSMRDVADAAAVPVAGVVYHFRRKEALYASVLAAIAGDIEASLALEGDGDFAARLDATTSALVAWTEENEDRVRLLVRELVDNPARVARAEKLPLAPVLTRMADFVAAGAAAGVFHVESAAVAALHLFGAVSYVVVARPTVRRIFRDRAHGSEQRPYERDAILFARRVVGIKSR